jgi:hypothetical protein
MLTFSIYCMIIYIIYVRVFLIEKCAVCSGGLPAQGSPMQSETILGG